MLAVLIPAALANVQISFSFDSTGKEEPEHILLGSIGNSAITPTEFSSGKLVTGHRKWAPFVITNPLGKNPVTLYSPNAGAKNVTITTYKVDATGKTTQFYQIHLTGAVITKDVAGSTPILEKLQITFQKIEWTWTDGGIPFSDDWTK